MGVVRRSFLGWARAFSPWHTPVIGTSLGLAYGIGEHLLDIQRRGNIPGLVMFHDLVEYLLPISLGMTAGLLINYARRQNRLNRNLSTENIKLQRQLFAQVLSAHILHEIRNPLHNLCAVIESRQRQMPEEDTAIIERNLDRLKLLADQLSRWNAMDESTDLRERTLFQPWWEEFLVDRVRPQLEQAGTLIDYRIEPVTVQMHPLLLEQCFVTLLNNALDAVRREPGPRHIVLSVRMSLERESMVEAQLRNSGARYPQAVLSVQANEPIHSTSGLGLGLVLARRALEQVGGTLRLANQDGQACTTLWIPGRCQ
jgi:C4-dicarboxylate-specific signal transduction histidine kinase